MTAILVTLAVVVFVAVLLDLAIGAASYRPLRRNVYEKPAGSLDELRAAREANARESQRRNGAA